MYGHMMCVCSTYCSVWSCMIYIFSYVRMRSVHPDVYKILYGCASIQNDLFSYFGELACGTQQRVAWCISGGGLLDARVPGAGSGGADADSRRVS